MRQSGHKLHPVGQYWERPEDRAGKSRKLRSWICCSATGLNSSHKLLMMELVELAVLGKGGAHLKCSTAEFVALAAPVEPPTKHPKSIPPRNVKTSTPTRPNPQCRSVEKSHMPVGPVTLTWSQQFRPYYPLSPLASEENSPYWDATVALPFSQGTNHWQNHSFCGGDPSVPSEGEALARGNTACKVLPCMQKVCSRFVDSFSSLPKTFSWAYPTFLPALCKGVPAQRRGTETPAKDCPNFTLLLPRQGKKISNSKHEIRPKLQPYLF